MDKKATSPELSPEDLKAIGEISLGPAKHEVFLNNHYKKVLCGIILSGIGIGLGIAFVANKQHNQDLAASRIVGSLSSGVDGAINPEPAASVIKEFIETPAASTAKLVIALEQLEAGEIEQALAALQSLATSTNDITISSRAAASIANYYMAENQNDEAIAAWKQVANMPANPYTALAYINLGDMAQVAGDKEAARSYYNSIKEKCETSAFINAQDVEVRLMLLDVDAPVAVAPKASAADTSVLDSTPIPDVESTISDINLDLDTGLNPAPAPVETPLETPVETPTELDPE